MGFGDLWKSVKKWGGIFSQPKEAAKTAPLNPNQPSQTPVQAPARQKAQAILQPPAAASPSQPPATAPPVTGVKPSTPAQFQPYGQWQLHVNDAARSVMYVNFVPNGVCFGSQFSSGTGHIQFNGRWGYNPLNRLLQLQGLINGVQPFMINIIIHGSRNNGFYGTGSDGYAYFISPYMMQ
jgi:hypothetical protein